MSECTCLEGMNAVPWQDSCKGRGPTFCGRGNSRGKGASQAPDHLGRVPARLQVTGVKVGEASGEARLWVARPTPGSPPQHSSQLGRTPPWRGCNLRTKILSRSSNVLLREGIPPHKALRGLPGPDRTDAGRLNSRELGGLWGLGSQGAGWVQEGGWVVMTPLLLTGTLGQGHAESGGPILFQGSKWPGQEEPGPVLKK